MRTPVFTCLCGNNSRAAKLLLDSKGAEVGVVEVRNVFKISKVGTIAGCFPGRFVLRPTRVARHRSFLKSLDAGSIPAASTSDLGRSVVLRRIAGALYIPSSSFLSRIIA